MIVPIDFVFVHLSTVHLSTKKTISKKKWCNGINATK